MYSLQIDFGLVGFCVLLCVVEICNSLGIFLLSNYSS
jgi:hypothetical protein